MCQPAPAASPAPPGPTAHWWMVVDRDRFGAVGFGPTPQAARVNALTAQRWLSPSADPLELEAWIAQLPMALVAVQVVGTGSLDDAVNALTLMWPTLSVRMATILRAAGVDVPEIPLEPVAGDAR